MTEIDEAAEAGAKTNAQRQREHIESLEQQLKDEKARADGFKAQLVPFIAKEAGFEPGIGALLADKLGDDVTVDAVKALADEHKLTPAAAPAPAGDPVKPGDPAATATSTAADDAAGRLDALRNGSTPAGVQTLQDQIAQADKAGDVPLGMQLRQQAAAERKTAAGT